MCFFHSHFSHPPLFSFMNFSGVFPITLLFVLQFTVYHDDSLKIARHSGFILCMQIFLPRFWSSSSKSCQLISVAHTTLNWVRKESCSKQKPFYQVLTDILNQTGNSEEFIVLKITRERHHDRSAVFIRSLKEKITSPSADEWRSKNFSCMRHFARMQTTHDVSDMLPLLVSSSLHANGYHYLQHQFF